MLELIELELRNPIEILRHARAYLYKRTVDPHVAYARHMTESEWEAGLLLLRLRRSIENETYGNPRWTINQTKNWWSNGQ